MVVSSALACWKLASVVLDSESPIVVVLSESMTPSFERGDLLFLSKTFAPYRVGDIVVFKLQGQAIPIVHRILELHVSAKNSTNSILTKGDYNPVDDRGLYNRGQMWITEDHIMGRVYAHLPYLGMVIPTFTTGDNHHE